MCYNEAMFDLDFNQVWIVLGLSLVIAELFIGVNTGFDLLIIGTIFIISGFLGLVFLNFSITLIFSILLAIIYFLTLRKVVRLKIVTPMETTLGVDQLIGQTALVTAEIAPHRPGKVKLNDEEWRARSSHHFSIGQEVKVVKISGITLIVNQIKKKKG